MRSEALEVSKFCFLLFLKKRICLVSNHLILHSIRGGALLVSVDPGIFD